jgi:hypothetical protein
MLKPRAMALRAQLLALARGIERIEALPNYPKTYPPHWRGP